MNIRLGIPSKLFAISVGLLALQSTAAFAAAILPDTTITFNDLTDSLTVTPLGVTGSPATQNGSCIGEVCTIDVLDPANVRGSGNATGLPLYILEPGSSIISDILDMTRNNNLCGFGCGGYTITFTSDTNETTGLGSYTSGDSIVETGALQTGFVITWIDLNNAPSATATIKFQSDLDRTTTTVPEPFTLSLFGAGLAGAVAMRRRKAKA